VRVMKALADASRLKIIRILQEKEMCVCEIRALLGLAQPTVSKHLKILEEAGLVRGRKEANWVNYRVAAPPGHPRAAAILEQVGAWLGDDPAVAALVDRSRDIDRADICRRPPMEQE